MGSRSVNGVKSFGDIASDLRALFELKGRALAARDDIIVDQIKGCLNEFAGKKIAVEYGTNHTPISYPFIIQGMASRVLLRDGIDDSEGVYRYRFDGQAERYARFGMGIPDSLIARLVMKSIVATHIFRSAGHQIDQQTMSDRMQSLDVSALGVADQAEAKVRLLDESDIEHFANLFDKQSVDPTLAAREATLAFLDEIVNQ